MKSAIKSEKISELENSKELSLETKDRRLEKFSIESALCIFKINLYFRNNVDKEAIGGVHTKITGSIYINDTEIEGIVSEAVRMYSYSNLLHPDIFCSARFIESELIKMGMDMFNSDKEKGCGITTSGGTESILFACMAYRNRAYKMGIKKPEM